MAIVTTNANTVTGSATNTLGTLGRSIFNSTIGTFADKSTMNQVYDTINKLTSSIENVDKTYDNEAVTGRNKADDLFSLLAGLDIKSSIDFVNKNREFMKRLMRLNKQEKEITLNALGVDVTGESDTVRNEYVQDYEYTHGNNYYEDYVKTLPQNQQIGDETTTLQLESSTNFNYAGIHNDLYNVTQNLYPDDENKGTFANKWIVENQNSCLYKTKKLFNAKKINTIISRFHTNPNKRPSLLDNAKSKYGLSHSRNLLTKQAEDGYNTKYANGYDNPYCRVWTHHHQYDRYYKTIRPFSHVDDQSNYTDTISVQEFHRWNQFSDDKDTNSETKGGWGWKKDSNNGWQYSVLQDNGKVNITPKYIKGESSNIHTKQCMFSIENLAWRGYDPYSFENALSWEQRGPLGGRIMWFPPYGIQFNETTTTQWNSNTFLGRGEDVYTYTNTTRTGTLSFMMVVDHPSIVDYVTWTNENKNVTDTDILRFFAGCGEGDGKGLRDYAKPTPLTDEYTQKHDEDYATTELTAKAEETTPDEEKPLDKILCFYVFYPNNYSGTYDDKEKGEYYNAQSKVEPIPYLLSGSGAQKNGGSIGSKSPFNGDEEIDWENGNGYEMYEDENQNNKNGKGLGKGNGYIVGTSRYQNEYNTSTKKRRYWKGLNNNGRSAQYSTGLKDSSKCKKWYYRIDGCYQYPQSVQEEYSHYYNQKLKHESSYIDENSYGLNCSINIINKFTSQIEKTEGSEDFYHLSKNKESDVYTLAEVAYVLYGKNSDTTKQNKCNIKNLPGNNRIKKLEELLSDDNIKRIKSITAAGYASAQGYVETNHKLGEHRAQTAVNWFMKGINRTDLETKVGYESNEGVNGTNIGSASTNDTTENGWTYGDEGEVNAKIWRYARVEVCFTTASTTEVAKSDGSSDKKEDDEVYSSGFYYGTSDKTPIDEKTIKQPVYNGKGWYNANYTLSEIKMEKDGDGYKFTKDGKSYTAENYQQVTPESICLLIGDEKSDNCQHLLAKQFSFTYYENKGETNEVKYDCVVYDYGDVISYAENSMENYYYCSNYSTTLKGEDFKWIFADINAIKDKASNNLTSVMTMKSVSYDNKNRKFTVTTGDGKTQEYTVVKYEVSDGDYKLTLDNYSWPIYVSKAEQKIDDNNSYVVVNMGWYSNAYYTKKNGEVTEETVLSVMQNGTEIIKITKNTFNIAFNSDSYNVSEYNQMVSYTAQYSLNSGIYTIKTDKGTFDIMKLSPNSIKVKLDGLGCTVQGVTIKDNSGSGSIDINSPTKKSRVKAKAPANDETTSTDEKKDDENKTSDTITLKKQEVTAKGSSTNYVGYSPTGTSDYYKGVLYPIYKDSKGKLWYKVSDPYAKVAKFISVSYTAEEDSTPVARYGNGKTDENRLRYDQEYHFFKVLKKEDPVVFQSLVDKLQYFDPAFHSMTPEGFSGRLTFLQQCMRQGNTVSASDGRFAKSANNLAFGRAPYCVLRLGDFYNQMIVIDNLSINYDPLVWDINVEGAGVIPLIAHVQLSFKFVGGSDMSGPVRRLQNAMSFNYYANTRLYDNRADRIERKWSDKTCGAIEHDEILMDTEQEYYQDKKIDVTKATNKQKASAQNFKSTYNKDNKSSSFYTTQMYK